MRYDTYKLKDICITVTDGSHYSPKAAETGYPMFSVKDMQSYGFDYTSCKRINIEDFEKMRSSGCVPQKGDVLVAKDGSYLKEIFVCEETKEEAVLSSIAIFRPNEKIVKSDYLCYLLKTPAVFNYISNNCVSGSALPRIVLREFKEVEMSIPDIDTQERITSILKPLDEMIRLNNSINKNLFDQTMTVFEDMFPSLCSGEHTVGEFITPKRGKGLLSKDAIPGNVPVVAGGLEPATYHNVGNTTPPVVTISASGANAGYVNLWQIPVWSSDSSFIDSTMTEDVFFWYVLLKKRQQEIFDAQTGSAQPHIYPQHISNLPLGDLDYPQITAYSEKVKPLFELVGHNLEENKRLSSIRDTLLPKLMSGEIDVSDLSI